MITEYTICSGTSSKELIENVRGQVSEGFQPFESVYVIGEVVYQPMVKRTAYSRKKKGISLDLGAVVGGMH